MKEAPWRPCWRNLLTDWEIPPVVTGTLVAFGFIYARGWLALRRALPKQIPKWRLFSFLTGLFAIFLAVSSSLDTYSETWLFMHMAQHFRAHIGGSSAYFEHFCFFATSLIFWWPIVQPWPARHRSNSWMIIPHLLTSDFVNTGLSAFLSFSGRLLYPSYGVVERPFEIDALKDQIAAGAFMWVFGSLVFLVPAIYLTTRLLSNGRLVNEKRVLDKARTLAQ